MAPQTSKVSESCYSASLLRPGSTWIGNEKYQLALFLVLTFHKVPNFFQGGWVKTFSRMDVPCAKQARVPGRDTKPTS